ncbi:MAG: hypothetical protein U0T81_14460 [Saprospiraceae bacterium]
MVVRDSISGKLLENAGVRITNIGEKCSNSMDGSIALFVFQDTVPYDI